jgi:hypothetical protein
MDDGERFSQPPDLAAGRPSPPSAPAHLADECRSMHQRCDAGEHVLADPQPIGSLAIKFQQSSRACATGVYRGLSLRPLGLAGQAYIDDAGAGPLRDALHWGQDMLLAIRESVVTTLYLSVGRACNARVGPTGRCSCGRSTLRSTLFDVGRQQHMCFPA